VVIRGREIRFGTIAVEKGFVTPGQLGQAVSIQMNKALLGEKPRLIGEILVEMGFMNPLQVNEVLEAQRKEIDRDSES